LHIDWIHPPQKPHPTGSRKKFRCCEDIKDLSPPSTYKIEETPMSPAKGSRRGPDTKSFLKIKIRRPIKQPVETIAKMPCWKEGKKEHNGDSKQVVGALATHPPLELPGTMQVLNSTLASNSGSG